MQNRPQARTEGVVAQRVDDELVIYDQVSQMAHLLPAAAASVWEHCDGHRSPTELARVLSLDPATIDQAVSELRRIGLLEHGPAAAAEYSRREAAVRIAKVGGAAFMAPMIYSVVIGPATASASACVTNGNPEPFCAAAAGGNKAPDARCCSGECYNGSTGKICVASNCSLAGIGCLLGGGTCCSGKCVAVICLV